LAIKDKPNPRKYDKNSEHLLSRAYPLVTEVYAVVRGDMPRDSSAVMLRDWFLTETGQATIEESGYVPIR
jgi:ABC-type phosphate transport system substrate-binding protein